MTIIDVREPEEFARGHVANAINIPASELNSSSELHAIPRDEPLVLYCVSGSRSHVAIQILKSLGFTNLTNGINKYHVEANLKKS